MPEPPGRSGVGAAAGVGSEGVRADGVGVLRTGRLAGLSMNRAILVLSWPVLLESFLNAMVGLTDTLLAARLPDGQPATSAIGGASYIMWFIGLIIMALGVGATALVSRSVGSGRVGVANRTLGQTVLFSMTVGVLVGVLIALSSGWVGRMMNLTDQAHQMFQEYMIVVGAGVPFTTLLFTGIACARGAGDSVRPLLAMLLVNVVNIVVSWMLAGAEIPLPEAFGGGVIPAPFGPALGVQGIAVGTFVAHVVGAALILWMAMRGTWGIRLRARWIRPHRVTIARLSRVGIPNFLETTGLWFGNFLIILMVGAIARGEELLGAHVVAIRAESFSFMPGFAMGAAAATLAGQYLGAGSPAHAKRAVIRCALIAAAVMGVIGVGFIVLARPIVAGLSSQPLHMEVTPGLLVVAGVVQVPFAFAIVTRAAMRGAGDVRPVLLITWVTSYGVRLPLAYALSGVDLPIPAWLAGEPGVVFENPFPFPGGLLWLWVALCSEIVIRSVIFSVRFAGGKWMQATV